MRKINDEEHLWVIVPVKRLDDSKSRLGELPGRRELMFAMAEATLSFFGEWSRVTGVICVTSDPAVRRVAIKHKAVVLDDPGTGLNGASSTGLDWLKKRGKSNAIIVHADFLRHSLADVNSAYNSYLTQRENGAVIGGIRSADGAGTNAIVLPSQLDFTALFGPNSFHRYTTTYQENFVEIKAPCFSHDIDYLENISSSLELGPAESKVDMVLKDIQDKAFDIELSAEIDTSVLASRARELRDRGHGDLITFSPKVFLPLTELCRDVCHYCTFAKTPKRIKAPYMTLDRVLDVARQGAKLGCSEALFTLGDRPEDRYKAARDWLTENGYSSTVDYLVDTAKAVIDETGLLPHINAGCLNSEEMRRLKPVSASMGLMLESASERLCEKGEAHYGSPDKWPSVRLAMIEEAGRQNIPFTTGILIGIGETRDERIDALAKINALHLRYGHIQEIIVQNFMPKPGTKMAEAEPAKIDEMVWTIAMARIIFGPDMSIQAPPNLNTGELRALINAGINDWGGVSPLTPDFVNPEAPWPEVEKLKAATAEAGKSLAPRLTIYPDYIADIEKWVSPNMRRHIRLLSDTAGLARTNDWRAGRSQDVYGAVIKKGSRAGTSVIRALIDDIENDPSTVLSVDELSILFTARDQDFHALCNLADRLRAAQHGDALSYVSNRNINYTNICSYKCSFCAFSKGTRKHEGAEAPYLLDFHDIARRSAEAWQVGAREVCLQGGIHPQFTGETYLNILRAVKDVTPDMHVHAFSPLEISHGAQTLNMNLDDYLSLLKKEGLGSLPGTAAEILDDSVRRIICPDKLNTGEWLSVLEAAHGVGLKTTSTIMYGHVETYRDWAIHLIRLRELQSKTGGITEFVPLPFVAHEAPMFKRGQARPGPTLREAILMHAVGRIVLGPLDVNIQASWVKLGREGMTLALQAGANDMGGTLINESITRAAGAIHGQMMDAEDFKCLASELGRGSFRRTTLYKSVEPTVRPINIAAESGLIIATCS